MNVDTFASKYDETKVAATGNSSVIKKISDKILVYGNNPSRAKSIDTFFVDFSSGALNWENEWETNYGKNDYREFYRVARLKGGYLIRSHQSYYSDKPHDYLMEEAAQVVRPYMENGFWNPEDGCWIRKIVFDEDEGWYSYERHDWGYSIDLEANALNASLAFGHTIDMNLDRCMASEIEYIDKFVHGDGSFDGLNIDKELVSYGLVLSSLALASRYYKNKLGYFEISSTSYDCMKKLFNYIRKYYGLPANICIGTSFIIRGMSNSFKAFKMYGDEHYEELAGEYVDILTDLLVERQQSDGSFYFDDVGSPLSYNVQNQLKADIALMFAYDVTGNNDLLESARKNIDWIIRNRWDRSGKDMGGLMWGEIDSTSYYECHQGWFAVATKLLEQRSDYDYSAYRAKAIGFLTDDNFAGVDLYLDNYARYGAFFSYRAISRNGNIQELPFHQFKGAYEIGVSLWYMALNYDMYDDGYTWLVTQAPDSASDGWDKALYFSRDFKADEWSVEWDVRFKDAATPGAYVGLFNGRNGDWRVLLDTNNGLCYRDESFDDVCLTGGCPLRSDSVYRVRCEVRRDGALKIVLSGNGAEILNSTVTDAAPFDSCYFGVFQERDSLFSASNIYIDNLRCIMTNYQKPSLSVVRQNFPNPFNGGTRIDFDLAEAARVSVRIYDVSGRLMRRLFEGRLSRGRYELFWNGEDDRGGRVESGVYFCDVAIGSEHRTEKLVVVR